MWKLAKRKSIHIETLKVLYDSIKITQDAKVALFLLNQPNLMELGASSILDIIYKHRKFLDFSTINQSLRNSKTSIFELAMHDVIGASELLSSRFAPYFTAFEIAKLHNQHSEDRIYFEMLHRGYLGSGKLFPTLTQVLSRAKKEGSIAHVIDLIRKNPILFALFNFEYKIRTATKVASGGAGTVAASFRFGK